MGFLALILIGTVIYFLFRNGNLKTSSIARKSPLDIATERFASGEIDEQTYRKIKETLKN